MNSPKHTPGPWDVEPVMSRYPHDIILDYDVPGEGRPIVIASVYYDENGGPTPPRVANANARLMAAAPELLASLKALLTCSLPRDVSGELIIQAAREAIAKAER